MICVFHFKEMKRDWGIYSNNLKVQGNFLPMWGRLGEAPHGETQTSSSRSLPRALPGADLTAQAPQCSKVASPCPGPCNLHCGAKGRNRNRIPFLSCREDLVFFGFEQRSEEC